MREERVQVSGHSAADPAAVWAVAGDFCGLWHPVMAEIRAERDARGALIRAFTAKGEDTLYRERLTYRSDSDRVLVYTHLEGIAGVESYVARLAVSPDGNDGSRVEWSARLTAEGDRASAIAAGTKAIFEMGIEALARVDEDPAPTPPHRGEGLSSRLASQPLLDESVFVEGSARLALTVASNGTVTAPHPAAATLSPLKRGEGTCGTGSAPSPFSPPAGRRCRQADEGQFSFSDSATRTTNGPLILFLHGIGGGRTNWLPQLAASTPYAHAAALDLRGYGDSQLGPSQSTVEDYCADILRIMDALGANRLVLCGLSYGSWLATSFAMRHPEKLAGLVLSGGCTGMSEASLEEREAFRQSREVPLDQGKTLADFAPAVVNVLAGPDASEEVRRQLFDSMAAIPAATYRDALNCFTHPPERFDFSKLTMPVLMMTGEHDRLAPPAEIRGVANRIAQTAPNAYVRFEVIAGAGHVCNVERPGAYNAVLTEFLSEVTP